MIMRRSPSGRGPGDWCAAGRVPIPLARRPGASSPAAGDLRSAVALLVLSGLRLEDLSLSVHLDLNGFPVVGPEVELVIVDVLLPLGTSPHGFRQADPGAGVLAPGRPRHGLGQ